MNFIKLFRFVLILMLSVVWVSQGCSRPQAAEVFTLTPSILHAGVGGPWFA